MNYISLIKHLLNWCRSNFPARKQFGYCATNAIIGYPIKIDNPQNFYLYENTKIRDGLRIINSPDEKVIIKKYSAIAPNVMMVTSNHTSTVGVPHILLGPSHVNDKSSDLIIEEECWVGIGVRILPGSHLGRGCIVGGGAVVNKKIPPYAVVVGSPVKIVAVKFSIDQILEHERVLYKEEERFTREYLNQLFDEYYEGKKVYGLSNTMTEEQKAIVESVKKRYSFVEPY